jgi:hypothetical protein
MTESTQLRSQRLRWLRNLAAELEGMRPGRSADGDVQKNAMRSLLQFYEGLAQWGAFDPAGVAELCDQVRHDGVAHALQDGRGYLSGYISATEAYAVRGRSDGYVAACQHRSALQLLIDEFPDRAPLSDTDRDELEDVDEELREAAEDAPPPHRAQIPSWAPRTHWWWWAPKRTDMSMREYRLRIYAGDLEEYDGSGPGSADWLRCGDGQCWCATAPA